MTGVKEKKVKKEKSSLRVWIENIVEILIVVICLVFSIIVISNPGGVSNEDYSKINVSSMPVLSDSMSGTFEKGDLIYGKKLEEGEILNIGEVAIFVVNDKKQSEVQFINTHRVVGYFYEYNKNEKKYKGYTDLLTQTLDYKNTEYNTPEKVIEYAKNTYGWTDINILGYITSGDNKSIYYEEDGKTLLDEENTNLIDNYIPLIEHVVGKWNGKKLSGVGGVITWMQQPTNFFFVIIIPLILLFGYNIWIVISYVIEIKTAKARKLALEEAAAGGISKEDEEEIKRKAIEEYLKKLEAEKASEEKVEEKKEDSKE